MLPPCYLYCKLVLLIITPTYKSMESGCFGFLHPLPLLSRPRLAPERRFLFTLFGDQFLEHLSNTVFLPLLHFFRPCSSMSRKTLCIPLFSPTPTVCITKYPFNSSIFRSHNSLYELFYVPNLFLLFLYDLFLVGIRFKGGGQRELKEGEGEG